MSNKQFTDALQKGAAGERLTPDEIMSLALLETPQELHQLGEAALANRRTRFGDQATYVRNLHINPSNICEGGCGFCKYSVKPGEAGAKTISEEEIFEKVKKANPVEVHVVGGMNREWNYKRSLNLIRALRNHDENLYIKGFTAVEIDNFARTSAKSTSEILGELKEAGLNGLPGGGAEIFSTRMREKYCPDKLSPEGWLEVHKNARETGLVSNATMLFGMDETPRERVGHLLALREFQDEHGGFSSFIPLAYQSGNDGEAEFRPSPLLTLSVIALSRLTLDNFPHIKAYWPMIGLATAAAAFSWGADDLDGTLGGEEIAHAAGAKTPTTLSPEQMAETITLAGFKPRERDGWFHARDEAHS